LTSAPLSAIKLLTVKELFDHASMRVKTSDQSRIARSTRKADPNTNAAAFNASCSLAGVLGIFFKQQQNHPFFTTATTKAIVAQIITGATRPIVDRATETPYSPQ
jgi:hypothetical protein